MRHLNIPLLLKIIIFFIAIFTIQLIAGYFLLKNAVVDDIKKNAYNLTQRIMHDIKIVNDEWDISLYNADPQTPYPHGSSGFSKPLYILTSSGFVIERNQPIAGFLDSSDFKHLLDFTSPATITAETGETWRVLSKPIIDDGKTIGVIVVSYFNAQSSQFPDLDKKLEDNAGNLLSQVNVKNNKISVENVDVRNIHYDVSFEVVNIFNKSLINNGRTPSFIDTSYIDRELNSPDSRIIQETGTNAKYITYTGKLYNNKKQIKGIVIAAEPVTIADNFLQKYLYYFGIISAITTPVLIFFAYRYLNKTNPDNFRKKLKFNKATFNNSQGIIYLDNKKYPIPKVSNQYYLIEAVFSNRNKHWGQRELLKRFGVETSEENWRKVYDAMQAINKRVDFKLIVYENKTYAINRLLS